MMFYSFYNMHNIDKIVVYHVWPLTQDKVIKRMSKHFFHPQYII